MLECRGVSAVYGQHQALHDVAISAAPSEIVVILGANGAGKSTLLMAIAGLIPAAASGVVTVNGRSVLGLPPHLIVEAGVALVPEDRRIFGDLSVAENLLLGAFAKRARQSEAECLDRVFSMFPRLAERRKQIARTLSGGEQQMVAIGRAVMTCPSILMLDEPSLGLSPLLCRELFRTLTEIRKTGVGILLVEQNAHQGLAIADRGYLLENGHIVGEDSAANLARNTAVQEAYLGGASASATVAVLASAQRAERVPTASHSSPLAHPALMGLSPRPTAPGSSVGSSIGAGGPSSRALAEMVARASQVQEAHIQAVRAARGSAAGGGSAGGQSALGGSLNSALAAVTAAAQRARAKPTAPLQEPGGGHQAAQGHTGPTLNLPVIEVYRRPKLEIYRRSSESKELVQIKGD